MLDTDPTENIVRWAERAARSQTWPNGIIVEHLLAPEDVEAFVIELEGAGEADLVVIDTAGHASDMHDAVASVSDLLLCPIQPSPSDLETAVGTANWMFRFRDRVTNPEDLPPLRVLVNRVSRQPTRTEAAVMQTIMTTPLVGGDAGPVEKLVPLPMALMARDAYRRMDAEGPLGAIIAQAQHRPERFLRVERHLVEALAEMSELLALCRATMEAPS